MANGVSLHIGLNHVDPNAYNGWGGELAGCINDANAMKAIADSLPHAVSTMNFPEAGEVIPILELGLNQAIAGEITSVAALNSMAEQIHAVMAKYKYNTGTLPKLN